MSLSNTIAAVATPMGTGGIGVIRISGAQSVTIAERVFRAVNGRKISDLDGYTALYGHIIKDGEMIDEAVALYFKAPHSYTGEDVIELSVHGGQYIVSTVLRTVLENGARLAENGEFTRRAYENGKLDLTEAEAVMALISAKSENARRAAMAAKNGTVSRKIAEIRDFLVNCASDLAAYTDYPDEDLDNLESGIFKENLIKSRDMLAKLLDNYDSGKMLREGIDTVIVGSPNVGKSTLMNLLSGENRVIVTDIPGTTRDIVEETVTLFDLTLRLSDTAGIRITDDMAEAIGVEKALSKLETAQLILAVFDASKYITDADTALLEKCAGRPVVVLMNKTDLVENVQADEKIARFNFPIINISALSTDSLPALHDVIMRVCALHEISDDEPMLQTERQRSLAQNAHTAVCEAIDALNSGFTLDAAGVCLDSALAELLLLTGERVTNTVADDLFRRFCVGK